MISRVQKTFLLLFAAGAAAFLLLPCLTGPDANGEIRILSLIAFFVGCVLLFLPWKIPRSEGGTERVWRLLLRLPVLLFPFVLVAVSFKGFFLFLSPEAEGIFLPLFWGLCLGSLLFSVLGGLAGRRLGGLCQRRAKLAGGLVLLGIAARMLWTYFR